MLILGVDVETNSLDKTKAEIIEIGCVLFDTDSKKPVNMFSRILPINNWEDSAEQIHKIDKKLSENSSNINFDIFDAIDGNLAKYIVCHNKEYDYDIVTNKYKKFNTKPWLCTYRDFNHSEKIKNVSSFKLNHLSSDYGISNFGFHRALNDALCSCHIASFYDLDKIHLISMEPKIKIITKGKWNKDNIDAAKSMGFKYHDDKYWYKICLSSEAEELIKSLYSKLNLKDWNIDVE